MKIVILNECFITKEHLDRLRKLGEVRCFKDTTTEKLAIERMKNVDVAVVDQWSVPYNEKVIGAAKNLKILVLNSTSFALVDLKTAKKHHILVANLPGYSSQAVAEMAIGLMFAVNRHIALADKEMRENPREIALSNKEYVRHLGFNVKGKTMGIIGLGKTGLIVAELAKGLGMNVIYSNRSSKSFAGAKQMELNELLKLSDVAVIAVPLNDSTHKLLGKEQFSKMKKNSILINVAIGGVVDTEALYHALKTGKIAGAGLDVLAGVSKDHALLKLKNVVFTPHTAYLTKESLFRLSEMIVENVEAFAKGKPKNLVN